MTKFNNKIFIVLATFYTPSIYCANKEDFTQNKTGTPTIQIILGSTRKGRSSAKIGNALKNVADKRSDITTEIVDLMDYKLPFLYSDSSPSEGKPIIDPIIKKWSKKIKEADAFIIIVPEYNGGYPGVLKNAMDLLYKEWSKKPVGFVGYSGGESGGKSAVKQLRKVCMVLKMLPIAEVNIPAAWKIFNKENKSISADLEENFSNLLDKIIKVIELKK